jgi:hypothetical protein
MSSKHTEVLTKLIPYRLGAVAALADALHRVCSWNEPQTMTICFGESLAIEGKSTAYTNPVIEAGLIHCRALLDFLGLRLSGSEIVRRCGRLDSDIGIEDFHDKKGRQLSMVDPGQTLSHYEGDSLEAQRSLAAVFHVTNKGLAHITSELSPPDIRLLEIASRGVPALVISHLYTPLGLPPPDYQLKIRETA